MAGSETMFGVSFAEKTVLPLDFELPPVSKADQNPWRRWIDTALESPHDIVPWKTAESVSGHVYRAGAHSVVMLFAELRSLPAVMIDRDFDESIKRK